AVSRGKDFAEVERALEEEIARFVREGPTRSELERVKTEIEASFVRGVEQVGGFGGKSQILAQNAVFGGRPDYYKRSFEVLEGATPETVRAVAAKWLGGPALTLEVHPFPEAAPATTDSQVDRSAPPIPAEFPDAPFPDFEQATLANGMRLLAAERRAVPAVWFSLQLNAGYAADQFAKPGTATLAMEMLDEGTRTRDALEISDELARLGAVLSSGSNLDF